jgi:hypothetical protein
MFVRSSVLPSAYVPVAFSCRVVPNASAGFAGVIAIAVSAAVPTPLKVAVCGLLLALSLNLSVPVLDPTALGENESDARQLAPPASVVGVSGQFELTGKSVALLVMLLIVSGEDWLLVSVTV